MQRSIFLGLAALALCGADPASAAGAPFGCGAGAGQICYFRIYYTPGLTRMVRLPAGMTTTGPDVDIGRARYCGAVGKPPAPKCSRKAVNADHND
jgi:hypothetical protein